MSINIKGMYVITFILSFFSAFEFFFIKGSGLFYNVAVLCGIGMFFLMLFCSQKKLLVFIKNILSIPVAKHLLVFLIYIIISVIIHYFLGFYKAPLYYYLVRIPRFYIYVATGCLLPAIGLFLGFKLHDIIKFFYISAMIIFIIGIVQYLSFLLHLNFMDYFFNFLTPERTLYKFPLECRERLRVYSVFPEPSSFGQYIFITMPFIISMAQSKYRLFKNVILNKVFKKSLVPIMLLNIIFTKSPIYLVLCFSEFGILTAIYKKELIKKYFSIILGFLVIFATIAIIHFTTLESSLEDTYIYRILNTIYSFGDFNKLVTLEPSLATRIFYYVNQFDAFKKNVLFGCGFHNVDIYLNKHLMNSSLPITLEAIQRYFNTNFNVSVAYSLFWTGLAEFGLVGMLIYISFVIKNVFILSKVRYLYEGNEQIFCQSLMYSIVSLFIISFYNINIDALLVWVIYGLSFAIIFNKQLQLRSKKCINK